MGFLFYVSPGRLWCLTNTVRSLFCCTKVLVASEIIASNDFVVSGFEYCGGELYSVIVSAHFSIIKMHFYQLFCGLKANLFLGWSWMLNRFQHGTCFPFKMVSFRNLEIRSDLDLAKWFLSIYLKLFIYYLFKDWVLQGKCSSNFERSMCKISS